MNNKDYINEIIKPKWQIKKLGNLCDVFTDGNWIESKDQSDGGIRLIQTGNIGEGYFKSRDTKARYISNETFKELKCTEIFNGDILISRLPDPVGRSCAIPVIGERMITAVDCSILRLKKNEITPEFFNYYAQSNQYLNDIESNTTGTTRKRISRKNLGLIQIPLPPLPEQKRIVALLDEVFAKLEMANKNVKENLESVKELFDSYLFGIKSHSEPLSSLVNITTGKLNANEAVEGGQYHFFTCSKEIFSIDKYAFDTEAILLAGNNAVGDFNVKHYKGKFNAYQRTYVITIKDENRTLYRHLYYELLKSLKEFKSKSVGAGTKFLKIGMIENLMINLPPLHDQKRIVARLDELSAETKKLEAIYKQKLAAIEELKKSILQKAFSGEL
ncbi:restriction endonuclease subunit S [Candidatus Gracilibacteria bacterium]|nr:restriction endonuclease subunit S [Candidatus Gracilibacteria bacterium]